MHLISEIKTTFKTASKASFKPFYNEPTPT